MTDALRRGTFREVFGIREFRFLWTAELLSIFGGILLGGLADRFPRRDLMMTVDLVRARR